VLTGVVVLIDTWLNTAAGSWTWR